MILYWIEYWRFWPRLCFNMFQLFNPVAICMKPPASSRLRKIQTPWTSWYFLNCLWMDFFHLKRGVRAAAGMLQRYQSVQIIFETTNEGHYIIGWYVYIYTYICIYIYIHIYIYTYNYVYNCIYIYTYSLVHLFAAIQSPGFSLWIAPSIPDIHRHPIHRTSEISRTMSAPLSPRPTTTQSWRWRSGWWLGHPSERYEFVNWDD